MQKIKNAIYASLIAGWFILCPTPAKSQDPLPQNPEWMKTATFYQIYPQSFNDSNGDGIGDIKGIIQKLEYIKWMGFNAIWLNPCFASEFQDAGYDVTDFYKVAKRYGTNKDLEKLFTEAHRRGIKVCLDLVAGHSSSEHPWFKASQKKKPNKYTDRYIWTNDSTIKPYKFISGKFERNGAYRKNFFDCQPSLNYGYAHPDPKNPWEQPVDAPGPMATRAELMKIMDFWLQKGADGFRVDMAPSLIKSDPEKIETDKMWHQIRTHMQTQFPQSVLIAEWGNPEHAIRAGFMIDFIIHLGNDGYSSMFFNQEGTYTRDTCYFSLRGNGTPTNFVNYYLKQEAMVGDKGYMCIPTANHDFQRPCCGERNTPDQLKCAMTFFMTMPGIALVYYGDEIGMRFLPGLPSKEGSLLNKDNNRAGSRTPMQWNNNKNAGFSTADASKLYLPIDPDTNRPNVDKQMKDDESLLSYTRQLVDLRRQSFAMGNQGKIKFIYALDKTYPLIYERYAVNERYIVVLNPSGQKHNATVTLDLQGKKLIPVEVNKITVNNTGNQFEFNTDVASYGIFKVQ